MLPEFPHGSHHSCLKQRWYIHRRAAPRNIIQIVHIPSKLHRTSCPGISKHHTSRPVQHPGNHQRQPYTIHAQRKVQCRQPAMLLPQNPARHASRVPSRRDNPNGLLQPALGRIARLKHSRHALGLPRARIQTSGDAVNRLALQPQRAISTGVVRVALYPESFRICRRARGIIAVVVSRTDGVCHGRRWGRCLRCGAAVDS